MITQTFDLNLIPNSAPVVIHVDQYDHGTGRLIAKLYNGSTAYTPAAGATAIIQGKKPDGHGFMYDATLSGNTVTADLTNQMSVVAGRVFVQFVITESDNRTGTFVFFLDVQPSALPADTEMSTSEYQVIEELLETAQAINENFPYIGANGHWFYYDVEQGQYVDSGVSVGTSISVGTTTTLPQGEDATVTNSGDNVNAVFNFGIPRGPKGDQGTPGATGPQGPQGEQGEKGEKGDTGNTGATPDITMSATADGTSSATPTVNVSKTGTAENPNFALAFSGIKGNQGEQGPQGETGATGATGNGIVSITKTGTAGLVDTYTILFTNGQTTTFTVTNGQDGTGSGDMTKAVYDPNNDVANAGGIPAYIGAYDFDAYLKMYDGTPITGADLDSLVEVGTYIKTATGLKANSPADLVAEDKYILAVMNAADNKNLTTEETLAGLQLLIAHINATNEIKVYLRGYTGTTGSFILTPHWTTWKSLDSPDVSGKADKVSGATNGDFAGLDANGNLTDSGSKASDFAAAGAALPTGGTTGQAVVKHSNADYDTEWGDVLSLEQAREAEVVEGKNHAYSQENNAVIATIENGKSYKVRWTGSATVTLKKNSASGTEVTSGSTSPLSFTADSDFDLYFGSSADVTEIMVYDGNDTSDTYEPYYRTIRDRVQDIEGKIPSTASSSNKMATASDITDVYEVMGQNGAKNFANCTMSTTTQNGVTATKGTSDNGGVTYTITRATQTAHVQFSVCNEAELLAYFQKHTGEKFILSGCPTGGNYGSGYSLAIYFNFDGTTIAFIDLGEGVEITVPDVVTTAKIAITIRTTATLNNTVFYPMLRLASDPDDTYVPYAMTNRELTELTDVKTYEIKNGNTAVTGVSVIKLGRWVFMDLTNVNVGTFLGAKIPNEIKPLVGCHFFGIVRDTNASGVQWQGLLDLTPGTQVQYIYYTDTYNTIRKQANTASTNLIISATAVYLSAT